MFTHTLLLTRTLLLGLENRIGSGMGAAAVFERGGGVDELCDVRKVGL